MLDGCGRTIDYLRLSVTDLCNYRCRYCMPLEGVAKRDHRDMLSLEELAEIAEACVRCGVKKIRLTGGEPLVRRGTMPPAACHPWTGGTVPHHQRLPFAPAGSPAAGSRTGSIEHQPGHPAAGSLLRDDPAREPFGSSLRYPGSGERRVPGSEIRHRSHRRLQRR